MQTQTKYHGLKQLPRCWNSTFDYQLKAMCFAQTTSDPCLYISTGEMFVIAVYYVDDNNYSTCWEE